MLRLFNTLTREKEIFHPLQDKKAGFYACGPTVYDFAHIGNLRTYLFEDILRRVLEFNDYKVKCVMNLTDVGHLVSDADTGEDKMEKGSRREGKDAWKIADFFIDAFKKDIQKLNIKQPDIFCRATNHIKEQIELIKILEKKGFTYQIADGVYFDTSKIKDYGKLARLETEGQKAGARVEVVKGKKNPPDFALWKLTPLGVKRQMEWSSPWGTGFPGWHLECSAMSQKYLGRQFDIHAGGVDHIPVHHTNEITQSEAAYGVIPAKFWVHGEFLLIDGNRMGKSVGNFITLENITKKFHPLAYRYLILTAHYRSQLNLTWESLEAAQNALFNLYEKMAEFSEFFSFSWWLKMFLKNAGLAGQRTKEAIRAFRQYREKFKEAVSDDLDTPRALSIMWQMVENEILPPAAKKILLLNFDKVLGLKLAGIKAARAPKDIKELTGRREKARQDKDWEEADSLRQEIEKRGWLIEDTPQGPKLKKKK